jgi:hypothetical protein
MLKGVAALAGAKSGEQGFPGGDVELDVLGFWLSRRAGGSAEDHCGCNACVKEAIVGDVPFHCGAKHLFAIIAIIAIVTIAAIAAIT